MCIQPFQRILLLSHYNHRYHQWHTIITKLYVYIDSVYCIYLLSRYYGYLKIGVYIKRFIRHGYFHQISWSGYMYSLSILRIPSFRYIYADISLNRRSMIQLFESDAKRYRFIGNRYWLPFKFYSGIQISRYIPSNPPECLHYRQESPVPRLPYRQYNRYHHRNSPYK